MKRKIAFVLLIVFLMIFIGAFSPLLFGKRSLTSTELTTLENIYKDDVNLDRIRIKAGGPLTWIYPGITLGNTISFPAGTYDDSDRKDQALLVHEVCHVWQYQHFGPSYIPRSLWELVTQRDTYVIHYDAEKSLRDYDIEEQCEIVAEFFLTENEKYAPYLEEIRTQE